MSIELETVQHVMWDWNGTLLDDADLALGVMNEMLARRGLPTLSPERYQALFSFPVRDYYAQIGFDYVRESFESVSEEFMAGYQAGQAACRLQEGAEALLTHFQSAGATQSILSASQQWRLEEQVRRLGVGDRFVRVLGLKDHFAVSKRENGQRWIAELGIDPRGVLLVGDTDHDAEVARAMGTRCVLVPSGHQSPARLRALGLPVFESLRALARHVASLRAA